MQETELSLTHIWHDLRRRKVFRVAAAYGVVAWLLVEISSVVLPALLLPDWALTSVVVVALVGFPIVLLIGWLFDLTERGIERTRVGGEHSERAARWSLRMIYAVGAIVAVMVVIYLVHTAGRDSDPSATRSIAVLPFTDFSEQQDSAYFGDGIAEELLNSLVRVEGLRVAARTSSFAFKGQSADIRDIGAQLNVATVLEGSVRRQGERIRITAQLINVEDGFHMWSGVFDRTMDDIFVVQGEIARAIVDALKLQLIGELDGLQVRTATTDIRAYDLYLEGRHYWHQRTAEAVNRALTLFEEAVQLDSQFALAYSGIADAHLILQAYGYIDQEEAWSRAEPAIAMALSLDSQLPEAYASLGLLRFNRNELRAAELAFRKAIELNPNYSMAHMWLGLLLRERDGLSAAYREFARAQKIDPLHPVINQNLAGTLANMGRYQEAEWHLRRVLEQQESAKGYLALATINELYGRFDQSIDVALTALEMAPDNVEVMASLARNYASLGEFEAAEEWIALMEQATTDEGLKYRFTRFYVDYLEGDVEALLKHANAQLVVSGESDRKLDTMERAWAGMALVLAGDFTRGAVILGEVVDSPEMEVMGEPTFQLTLRTLLAHAYLELGRQQQANAVLDQGLELAARARASGWADPRLSGAVAAVLICRGRPGEALEELQLAVSQGWNEYWSTLQTPFIERVRQMPEFQQVMTAVKEEIDRMRARVAALEAERGSGVLGG